MDENKNFCSAYDEGKFDALSVVDALLDSMQEEPVSERFTFKAIPRLLEMIEPTDRAKAYIAKLADILEVEGYSTDAKIVRESLKIMNGEKVAMATMDEVSVSEDLESWDEFSHIDDAIEDYCRYDNHIVFFTESLNGEPLEEADDREQIESAFRAGANWQKEQMMSKAIVREVKVDAGGYPYIPQMELYDYDKDVPLAKEGDKVKVIVTKEE